MAKLAQTSVKYVVRAKFYANGVIEKPDIIGALFGQTEGLLGPDLDLRELQRTGKIGRIDVVNIKVDKGKTTGEIIIPSSLGSTESALIAAAIETIERIGPCDAEIKVEALEDLRTIKRKYITERAKDLLASLLSQVPDLNVLTEEILQSVRAGEITEYQGMPAGPDVATSEEVIFVEGRADVINLLKHGVKNAIAIGGTFINDEVVNLSKERIITVFLDGDRGGDLILKELQEIGAEIDYIARAPQGKEVEELTKKEVFKALRDRLPVNKKQIASHETKEEKPQKKPEPKKQQTSQAKHKVSIKEELPEEVNKLVNEQLEEILGTRASAIFDENLQLLGRVPVKELANALKQVEKAYVVITDGEITMALLKVAEAKGVKVVASTKKIPVRSRKIVLIQG